MKNPNIGDVIYVDWRLSDGRHLPTAGNHAIGLVLAREDTSNMWHVYINGKITQCFLLGIWYHSIEEELK